MRRLLQNTKFQRIFIKYAQTDNRMVPKCPVCIFFGWRSYFQGFCSVVWQFGTSAFHTVVLWHKLGEVENECTSHNFSFFAIFLSKIIKIGGNLTKFWQIQICTVFLRHGVYRTNVVLRNDKTIRTYSLECYLTIIARKLIKLFNYYT